MISDYLVISIDLYILNKYSGKNFWKTIKLKRNPFRHATTKLHLNSRYRLSVTNIYFDDN